MNNLHPIFADIVATLIPPAPECIYCFEPVCDGSMQTYEFASPAPAHAKCIERAEEAQFDERSQALEAAEGFAATARQAHVRTEQFVRQWEDIVRRMG